MNYILIALAALVVFIIVRFYMLGKESQKMSVNLGLKNGKLKVCESPSNCSSSDDIGKEMRPLVLSENPIPRVEKILLKRNMAIQDKNSHYIHATHQSSGFGFVDDIEFYYDNGELHYRSASRVGKSDLGVNRKRLESIIKELKAPPK